MYTIVLICMFELITKLLFRITIIIHLCLILVVFQTMECCMCGNLKRTIMHKNALIFQLNFKAIKTTFTFPTNLTCNLLTICTIWSGAMIRYDSGPFHVYTMQNKKTIQWIQTKTRIQIQMVPTCIYSNPKCIWKACYIDTITWQLGKTSIKKKRFLSGIARIT